MLCEVKLGGVRPVGLIVEVLGGVYDFLQVVGWWCLA